MFKNEKDILPVSAITLGLVLCLMTFLVINEVTLFFALVGIALRFLAQIHHHYHAHNSTFRNNKYNFFYDIILMLAGGSLTSMWKIHHNIGHHQDYLDQENDVEGNDRFGKEIPFKRLVFTILGDALTIKDCYTILKRRNLINSKLHKKMKMELALQLLFNVSLAFINIKTYLLFIYLPNRIYRWSVFWFSYAQHDDMPMESTYSSSLTNFNNNKLFLNVGHHAAHHDGPGIHWSLLEERTMKNIKNIPKSCIKGSPSENSHKLKWTLPFGFSKTGL